MKTKPTTKTRKEKPNPPTENSIIYPLDQIRDLFTQCRTELFYEYFNNRRIEKSTLDEFKVGYSPPWLHHCIPEAQWAPYISYKLLTTRSGSESPFGNLFSFPFQDKNGHTISFQFRNTTEDEEDGNTKYWNLPAQRKLRWFPFKIFKPLLYGHPKYGDAHAVTIVEGPIDVYRCVQAKLPNPQAVCGLGVNSSQLLKALRGKRVYLMLDWDAEGRRKTFQLATEYLSDPNYSNMELIIVSGPWGRGKDPADLWEEELTEVFHTSRFKPDAYVRDWIERGIDKEDPSQVKIASGILYSVERLNKLSSDSKTQRNSNNEQTLF